MEDKQFDLCMSRIRQGDKDALREIYQAYAGYIFHLIQSVLQNRENAEDVTSEFFIKLWDLADHYQPGGGHRAYLGRIAHNMAIDYLRAHKREVPWDVSEGGFENMQASQDQSIQYASDEDAGVKPLGQSEIQDETADAVISDMTVQQILGMLKPAEREVVHLKIIGEMTFEEIARLLDQPMGTVTWRYREAIKKLRRCGFDA